MRLYTSLETYPASHMCLPGNLPGITLNAECSGPFSNTTYEPTPAGGKVEKKYIYWLC